MGSDLSEVASILRDHRDALITQWRAEVERTAASLKGRASIDELASQAREFLRLLEDATRNAAGGDDTLGGDAALQTFLRDFSRERVLAGFTAEETATFIFSFKRPIFDALRAKSGKDPERLAASLWQATALIDRLGLQTFNAFAATRESVIARQQHELLELSTPVVKLWDGVLALPIIGTLDSARTQIVMESLLQRIADTNSAIAIIDITGVPTVDTLVAQHLIKTATAIRLMGADCVISGVRPQIAQTIVQLGVDLGGVTTKANLADALSVALDRIGYVVSRGKA